MHIRGTDFDGRPIASLTAVKDIKNKGFMILTATDLVNQTQITFSVDERQIMNLIVGFAQSLPSVGSFTDQTEDDDITI